jgi:hypothetical protein
MDAEHRPKATQETRQREESMDTQPRPDARIPDTDKK